jgi:HlyD family secretion protein
LPRTLKEDISIKTLKAEPVNGEGTQTLAPAQQSGMDRTIQKKRWTPRNIALVSGGGVVLFCILYYLILGDHRSRLNVEAEKITIAEVTRGQFQEFDPVQGSVQPIQTFFLDAVEGGRVDSTFVEAGSFVKRGDRILKLVNTNLQLDVLYREALLFEQINNARNTRLAIEQNTLALKGQLTDVTYQIQRLLRQDERDSVLLKKGLIAAQDFQQVNDEHMYWIQKRELTVDNIHQDSILRHTQIEQLDASVKRMTNNLDLVKRSMDNLVVRAPISGQLTSRSAEIGESKSPGQRLGQIDVLDGFKVRAPIDEFYIARVNPGQRGAVDLNGKTYSLTVTKVYPEVRDGRFEVDLLFDGSPPPGIRRGQTLQVRLELGDLAEAVMVPRGGFYQKTGGQWIYVVDRSGAFAVKRPIRLGRQNPQVFEVLEGLEPGEQVVTSSYDNFGDIDKLVLTK